ncbi:MULTISPECIES: hypothetical protein [unclassified Streptomyces]
MTAGSRGRHFGVSLGGRQDADAVRRFAATPPNSPSHGTRTG